MNHTATNPYLRTRVLTASPQQLRLMLYEGAIKFCRQGRHALSQNDLEGMYNALTRAQKIVLELSTSLDHTANRELCDRMSALYDYMYRRLVDANMERDGAAIDECIHLLEYERETWLMLMKRLEETAASEKSSSGDSQIESNPTPQPSSVPPNVLASISSGENPHTQNTSASPTGGFSTQG